KGFFGEIELFDNGQGKDEKALDGVFSGSATVPENTGGKTWVLFTAGVAGETIEITAAYAIAPVLELSLSTQQDSYMLGDLVKVSGEANKKRLPLFGESILVEFKSGAKTVSSQNAPVNELGFFEAEYRTSSVEEDGGLEVTAAAKDSFGNTANVSKTIFLPKQPRPVQGPVQNEAGQKINPASENITALQGTLLGVAQKNFLLVFAVLIAVAAVLVSKFLGKEKMQAKNRQEEEKRLTGELEHAQDLYFKKGLMSRKDYDEKMMKLEAKLLETRKKSRGKHT
ncbi:MAG: choice-of-anchor X domain-containing protein, partial [archaeon]|nr:choice-of-anchor X domain-containing protein [archaeon]